jgi:hypothetical protein
LYFLFVVWPWKYFVKFDERKWMPLQTYDLDATQSGDYLDFELDFMQDSGAVSDGEHSKKRDTVGQKARHRWLPAKPFRPLKACPSGKRLQMLLLFKLSE